jgi:hypothetical protein
MHRTNRATSPTTGGRPACVTHDLAMFSNQDRIFLRGSLYPRMNRIPRPYWSGVRSLAIQGARQAPQIARVRDCRDVPYKLPSNAEFEISYAVFKASRGCLEGGSHRGRASSPRTLSNGFKLRLVNPRKLFIGRVYGPRADPYRTGHGRPLE